MNGEIILRRPCPLGPHRSQPGLIRFDPQPLTVCGLRCVQEGEQSLSRRTTMQREENPAALLAPVHQPGLDQNANMAGDARLALANHQRNLADSQFHLAQQVDDTQARGISECAEKVELAQHLAYVQASLPAVKHLPSGSWLISACRKGLRWRRQTDTNRGRRLKGGGPLPYVLRAMFQ